MNEGWSSQKKKKLRWLRYVARLGYGLTELSARLAALPPNNGGGQPARPPPSPYTWCLAKDFV